MSYLESKVTKTLPAIYLPTKNVIACAAAYPDQWITQSIQYNLQLLSTVLLSSSCTFNCYPGHHLRIHAVPYDGTYYLRTLVPKVKGAPSQREELVSKYNMNSLNLYKILPYSKYLVAGFKPAGKRFWTKRMTVEYWLAYLEIRENFLMLFNLTNALISENKLRFDKKPTDKTKRAVHEIASMIHKGVLSDITRSKREWDELPLDEAYTEDVSLRVIQFRKYLSKPEVRVQMSNASAIRIFATQINMQTPELTWTKSRPITPSFFNDSKVRWIIRSSNGRNHFGLTNMKNSVVEIVILSTSLDQLLKDTNREDVRKFVSVRKATTVKDVSRIATNTSELMPFFIDFYQSTEYLQRVAVSTVRDIRIAKKRRVQMFKEVTLPTLLTPSWSEEKIGVSDDLLSICVEDKIREEFLECVSKLDIFPEWERGAGLRGPIFYHISALGRGIFPLNEAKALMESALRKVGTLTSSTLASTLITEHRHVATYILEIDTDPEKEVIIKMCIHYDELAGLKITITDRKIKRREAKVTSTFAAEVHNRFFRDLTNLREMPQGEARTNQVTLNSRLLDRYAPIPLDSEIGTEVIAQAIRRLPPEPLNFLPLPSTPD